MKKRMFVAGFIVGGLIFGSIGAYAADSLEKISAYLNYGVKFKLNGVDWKPKNDKGEVMYPVNYNGSNYLPAKAIASALNVAVDYDSTSNTILLGEKTDHFPLTKLENQLNYRTKITKDPALVVADGKNTGDSFNAFEVNSAETVIKIYPHKKYQTLSVDAASLKKNITLAVYGDGVELQSVIMKPGDDAVHHMETDIGGVELLEFKLVDDNQGNDDGSAVIYGTSFVK